MSHSAQRLVARFSRGIAALVAARRRLCRPGRRKFRLRHGACGTHGPDPAVCAEAGGRCADETLRSEIDSGEFAATALTDREFSAVAGNWLGYPSGRNAGLVPRDCCPASLGNSAAAIAVETRRRRVDRHILRVETSFPLAIAAVAPSGPFRSGDSRSSGGRDRVDLALTLRSAIPTAFRGIAALLAVAEVFTGGAQGIANVAFAAALFSFAIGQAFFDAVSTLSPTLVKAWVKLVRDRL